MNHSNTEQGQQGHTHTKNLAHHFDTSGQQFNAAKLGMWTFLATEILMFGGLFCAYAVYRSTRPEIFLAGRNFLDTNMGALNTIVLIASSFTMAWAVRCAQLNKQRALVVLLSLTFLGGAVFMGVKYVEYKGKWDHGLFVGNFYNPDEAYFAEHVGGAGGHGAADAELDGVEPEGEKNPAPPPAEYVPSDTRGRMVFSGTCSSCHGPDGGGMVNQGANLHEGGFVASKNDKEMLTFLKLGRQSWDADSKMKLQMPPRGGNPALTDDHLKDVIAYLRVLVKEDTTAENGPAEQPSSTPNTVTASAGDTGELTAADLALLIPRSNLPPATEAPAGLNEVYFISNETPAPHATEVKPEDLRMFFSIYFLLTGLHGLHVLIGMFVMLWLIVRALKGHFGPDYFTPVDMGGLYWHLVDLIWIFVFPLIYLIH
jgi:cytochrome c oxidase subunit III